jgi:DNA-binding response OmpR family regulator
MKILHIDDCPEICKMYADMFAEDYHSIRSINSGKEGLELVIKNDYDLILLDICMPKYSGIKFLRELKNKRPSELKKVVVVSVLDFNESQVKEFLKFGIHSVEEKPSDLQSLVDIPKNMFL